MEGSAARKPGWIERFRERRRERTQGLVERERRRVEHQRALESSGKVGKQIRDPGDPWGSAPL